MSTSREGFVGITPGSGEYNPKPVPDNQEDQTVYINDELLTIGGKINDLYGGGMFPPHISLPRRVKDSMTIYFSSPIEDSEIIRAGLWIYKSARDENGVLIPNQPGRWWQLIDDPSQVGGEVPQYAVVYQIVPDDSVQPSKPVDPINADPRTDGWSRQQGERKGDQYTWASNVYTTPSDPAPDWSIPYIIASPAEDGAPGPVGPEGPRIEHWFCDSTDWPGVPEQYPPIDPNGLVTWSKEPPTEDDAVIWSSIAEISYNDLLQSPWSYPVRWNGDDGYVPVEGVDFFSKDGAYNSWVYITNITPPATPTGGSFNGTVSEEVMPSSVEGTWRDGPYYEEGKTTWVSSNKYEHIPEEDRWQQVGSWSSPSEYSKKGDNGDTIYEEYQYSVDGDVPWSNDLLDIHYFRRERTVTNGVPGPWSDPARIKTDGEDGKDGKTGPRIEYWFADSVIRPQTPNNYPPIGDTVWQKEPFDSPDNWSSLAEIDSNDNLISLWSFPTKWNGEKGEKGDTGPAGPTGDAGVDGDTIYTEFWFSDTGSGNPDTSPANWSTTQTVNSKYQINKTITNGVDGPWSSVSKFVGDDGATGPAGKYFETRYLASVTQPATPPSVSEPTGWTLEIPEAVYPVVVWATTSSKNSDGTLDTNWSDPRQWNGSEGEKGIDGPTGPQGPAGNDGVDGDTIYTEFWYSSTGTGNPDTNPSNWGTTQRASDIYVINRVVNNGVNGAWSDVTKYVGSDSKSLRLISTAQAFHYDSEGNGGPDDIVFTLVKENITESTTWTSIPDDRLTATTNTQAILSLQNFGTEESVVVIASSGGYEDRMTIVRLSDGVEGESAYTGYLTNESHTVSSNNDGSGVDLTGSSTELKIFKGTSEVRSGVVYSSSPVSSGTFAYTFDINTGELSPINVDDSVETYSIVITGAVDGEQISKTYSFTKSKTGNAGQDGAKGDSITEEYRYNAAPSSSGATGWDVDARDTDYYRQRRTLINGSVDYTGNWHLFRLDGEDGSDGQDGQNGQNGQDGTDGDTLKEEYRYNSVPSDTNAGAWGADPEPDQNYRRMRVLLNGVQDSIGNWHIWKIDGKFSETRYQASETQPENPSNVSDPFGWSTQIPAAIYPVVVWASTATKHADGTLDSNWSDPRQWTGERGSEGPKGGQGDTGQRGSIHVLVRNRNSWSDQSAYNAIVSEVVGLSPDIPIPWDSVQQTNDSTFTETRRYVGGGDPGTWEVVDTVIDGNLIVTDTISTDALKANSITTEKIEAGAVVADKISANSITAGKIAADAVTANKIQAGAVETDKLAANSVSANKITANAVTTDKLAANSVNASKIVANTITGNEISSATKIEAGTSGTNYAAMSGVSGDHGFWAGDTNDDIAPFRVTRAGALTATSANITGDITAYSLTLGPTPTVDSRIDNQSQDWNDVSGTGKPEDNATNTTNTNQLTDGANLGGTATWSGVSGTGKPADNADVTDYNDSRIDNDKLTKTNLTSAGMYPDQSALNIKSSNYSSGVSGWAIDNNGFAEFQNTLVRGTVYATDGVFDGTVYASKIEGDVITRLWAKPATTGGNRKERIHIVSFNFHASTIDREVHIFPFEWGTFFGPSDLEFYLNGSLSITENLSNPDSTTKYVLSKHYSIPLVKNQSNLLEIKIVGLDDSGGDGSPRFKSNTILADSSPVSENGEATFIATGNNMIEEETEIKVHKINGNYYLNGRKLKSDIFE